MKIGEAIKKYIKGQDIGRASEPNVQFKLEKGRLFLGCRVLNEEDVDATDWVEEKKETLSDKIVRVNTSSLEFPNDGRRKCEMVTHSELFCNRTRDAKRHYARELIEIEDVKQANQKLDGYLCGELTTRAGGSPQEHRERDLINHIRQEMKEIYGERLI